MRLGVSKYFVARQAFQVDGMGGGVACEAMLELAGAEVIVEMKSQSHEEVIGLVSLFQPDYDAFSLRFMEFKSRGGAAT